ncbi:para-nitrobenzyl esterase [Caulobacter ginsengisoli]|uniref:Carboxylic ester hydrolase n=1 Tax=Caulobacter ginsengisoli TaxID=400775 RepID=A0ABU0IUM3_9CAUL|nr:carboxylesterase family protein [Caulobacter ginsengisoli]MDQ0465031.1 para-nitrobenzyl esterase [Caulobacter ginsengisoli]
MIRPLLAAVLLTLTCAAPAWAADNPLVEAPAGRLEGRMSGEVRAFKGIPYAAAPVGDLRWAPPRPAAHWDGLRQADDFGPACPQFRAPPGGIYWAPPPPMSEDCLSLNVWAPAKAGPKDSKGAPVIVWIHGGSFAGGSSRETLYEGTKMAGRGVVVVSINYRLGVLGFLAHPELSAESPDGLSGNWGLLDQVEALRWVQRNIAAFGGDPGNVTIAGESAGGLSVAYLMAMPSARGLFAKAILQSAYTTSAPELKQASNGTPSAEASGQALAARLGAADVASLRAIDADKLIAKSAFAYFPFPTVDGKLIPRQLVDTFDRGEQAPVPLIAGFNSGEIRSLMILAPKTPLTAGAYEKTIRDNYGDLADSFLGLYPSRDMGESILATTRDGLYGWTAWRLAAKQTAAGQSAYLYIFDHSYPAADSAGLHAFHGAELPYMFGNINRAGPYWPAIPQTPGERAMADAMVDYWVSFATTGRPKARGAPDWPAFGRPGYFMAFQDVPKVSADLLPGVFALHESVVCRRRAAGTQPWVWNLGLAAGVIPPKAEGC